MSSRCHPLMHRILPALGVIATLLATTLEAQERATVRLPGLSVRSGEEWCPRRDRRDARALWNAMRARYDSAAADTVSLWSPLRNHTARTRAGEIRLLDSLPANRDPEQDHGWNVADAIHDRERRLTMTHRWEWQGAGERGMNGLWRREWQVRIARRGYGIPYSLAEARGGAVAGDVGGAFERWQYPPLEAELASHFAEAEFGARHVFEREPASAAGPQRIRFCTAPRFRGQPWLEGVLTLGRDTALHRVEWRFRAQEGDEGAGGVVEFAPAADGVRVPVAARSVYFRRAGLHFFVRQQHFAGWRTGSRAAALETLGAAPLSPSRNR